MRGLKPHIFDNLYCKCIILNPTINLLTDLDFGAHRARSNTAARLEKMDRERKRAAKTKHIKWEAAPVTLSSLCCPLSLSFSVYLWLFFNTAFFKFIFCRKWTGRGLSGQRFKTSQFKWWKATGRKIFTGSAAGTVSWFASESFPDLC